MDLQYVPTMYQYCTYIWCTYLFNAVSEKLNKIIIISLLEESLWQSLSKYLPTNNNYMINKIVSDFLGEDLKTFLCPMSKTG